MSNQIQVVNFNGDTLVTLEYDGEQYVAVRPIVENMGLEWSGQQKKLTNTPKFSCVDIYTTGKDGKSYKMLCLPIRKLNGWLFSINPEKVRADIRHIVEQYQEECFQVLYDYWNNGIAVNPRLTSADTLPLRNAVNMATGILKLDYATIYKMVHQRFGISDSKGSKIKTLTKEQIPQAVEYVHHLILTHKDIHAPIKGIDPKMLYDTLAECAVRLQEFCTVLAQLELLGYQHQDKHYHPCFERPISPPAKAHNGLVDLVNALNLRNKYGVPMFVNKQINWYDGNSTTYICQ